MQRLLLVFALLVAGCAPEIGDACDTSTDCSQGGELRCDVSQAQHNGYCTVFGCEAGKCPEEATCVVFDNACTNVSGTSPSQRSFCMRTCEETSDCRPEDGYACLAPSKAGGLSVDGHRLVCMLNPVDAPPAPTDDAGVCESEIPISGGAGAGAD
jgi:hypothetical protein